MRNRPDILIFGAGVMFQRFIDSSDADGFNILAVLDNQKSGDLNGYKIDSPQNIEHYEFDFILLTLWDNPKVIKAVSKQLLQLGVSREKIKLYGYDRHIICELDEFSETQKQVQSDQVLYAFYDLNRSSETYDITSFLVTADCYREELGLACFQLVVVARDEQWRAQALCLEDSERHWRMHNIMMQSVAISPGCRGVSYTSHRDEARYLLEQAKYVYPPNCDLASPAPITVHKDFYYWWRKGVDPRRLQASPKAAASVNQWWQHHNSGFKRYLTVTLRESSLQPKRNSDLPQWERFFRWLSEFYPELAVVIIRDTEAAFEALPFTSDNVMYFPVAAFHVDMRMAIYEQAWLNMGCSNGPKQLCHLSTSASYITCKMIVEDYEGTSTKRFLDRDIAIGEPFEFAGDNQVIDWRPDDFESLKDSFLTFLNKFPFSDGISSSTAHNNDQKNLHKNVQKTHGEQ